MICTRHDLHTFRVSSHAGDHALAYCSSQSANSVKRFHDPCKSADSTYRANLSIAVAVLVAANEVTTLAFSPGIVLRHAQGCSVLRPCSNKVPLPLLRCNQKRADGLSQLNLTI